MGINLVDKFSVSVSPFPFHGHKRKLLMSSVTINDKSLGIRGKEVIGFCLSPVFEQGAAGGAMY